jgi:hypothetical protein
LIGCSERRQESANAENASAERQMFNPHELSRLTESKAPAEVLHPALAEDFILRHELFFFFSPPIAFSLA